MEFRNHRERSSSISNQNEWKGKTNESCRIDVCRSIGSHFHLRNCTKRRGSGGSSGGSAGGGSAGSSAGMSGGTGGTSMGSGSTTGGATTGTGIGSHSTSEPPTNRSQDTQPRTGSGSGFTNVPPESSANQSQQTQPRQ